MRHLRNVWLFSLLITGLLFHPLQLGSRSALNTPGSYSPRPASGAEGYALEYEGHAAYRAGDFEEAVGFYSRARALLPQDKDIALSLGLALSRNGHPAQGRALIGQVRPRQSAPGYARYKALRHAYTGMAFAYEGHFAYAMANYRKSLHHIDPAQEPMLASLIHNAYGFAIMLNQGGGEHGKDMPAHYHVHRRDMEQAITHFRLALLLDPKNSEAQENYALLLKALDAVREDPSWEMPKAEPPLAGLMDQIEKAFDFLAYDEVAFLLDISGSMIEAPIRCNGYNRYSLMKGVMALMLDEVPESTELGLGTVGGPCEDPPAYWHPIGAMGTESLRHEVSRIGPKGTTPLFATIQASTDLFSDELTTSKGVFLITDGDDMCGSSAADLCGWADANEGRLSINVLTFLGIDTEKSNQKAFGEYACLARQTGGELLYVDDTQCRVEKYAYAMHSSTGFVLPDMFRLDCWGPAVPDLWGIWMEPIF